jgi:hypothetical protein
MIDRPQALIGDGLGNVRIGTVLTGGETDWVLVRLFNADPDSPVDFALLPRSIPTPVEGTIVRLRRSRDAAPAAWWVMVDTA